MAYSVIVPNCPSGGSVETKPAGPTASQHQIFPPRSFIFGHGGPDRSLQSGPRGTGRRRHRRANQAVHSLTRRQQLSTVGTSSRNRPAKTIPSLILSADENQSLPAGSVGIFATPIHRNGSPGPKMANDSGQLRQVTWLEMDGFREFVPTCPDSR